MLNTSLHKLLLVQTETALEIKSLFIDTSGAVHILRRYTSYISQKDRMHFLPSEETRDTFWGFVLLVVFSFLWQTPALPAALPRAHRKEGEGGGRHTGKAHWQSMGHGPQLTASTQHNRWRLSAEKTLWRHCTQTLPVDLARCGFGRRWEETAQRGHNYSAAASTASTSNFCREESLTKHLAQLCVTMSLSAK